MKTDSAFEYLTKDERSVQAERIKGIYQGVTHGELFNPDTPILFKKYISPHSIILDLGSSTGRIFPLLDLCAPKETHGADIGNYLTFGKPSSTFKTFDFSADRYPYDDATFDAITCIEVVEHLENPFHFLREAARILKPGGVFIVSTPNPEHIWSRISYLTRGKFHRFLDGNDHIMLYAHYIRTKGADKYFNLLNTVYMFGELPYRIFKHFTFPENKLFGRTAFYIYQKK
jgi:ubiquinone/menaquinone biosynthesis C-methylase UbiE